MGYDSTCAGRNGESAPQLRCRPGKRPGGLLVVGGSGYMPLGCKQGQHCRGACRIGQTRMPRICPSRPDKRTKKRTQYRYTFSVARL